LVEQRELIAWPKFCLSAAVIVDFDKQNKIFLKIFAKFNRKPFGDLLI
jgi:hypothetical protein